MKQSLKIQAIKLRKEGLSYSEIRKRVPVSKSTLSLWFKNVKLSKEQQQILYLKRCSASLRGAAARRKQRIEITRQIKDKARAQIANISKRELWLVGIMLYWAEGSKERDYRVTSGVTFTNSDPFMAQVFIKWLLTCLDIPEEDINLSIYIHETKKDQLDKVKKYWTSVTRFSTEKFGKIYFKKHKINSKRRNRDESYYGLLRIQVRRSTNLNRKIAGWIEGITANIMGSGVTVTRLSLEQRDSRFKS